MDQSNQQIRPVDENLTASASSPRIAEFRLTRDDLHLFLNLRRKLHKQKGRYRPLLFGLVMAGIVLWFWAWPLWEKGAPWHTYIGVWNCYLLVFLFISLFPWLGPWLERQRLDEWMSQAKPQAGPPPVRAAIEPDGFRHTMKNGETMRKWDYIERIVLDEEMALFILDANTWIPIPRHAFRTHEDFQAFVALAQNYHRLARPKLYIKQLERELS